MFGAASTLHVRILSCLSRISAAAAARDAALWRAARVTPQSFIGLRNSAGGAEPAQSSKRSPS